MLIKQAYFEVNKFCGILSIENGPIKANLIVNYIVMNPKNLN